jgi:hypothetical protein
MLRQSVASLILKIGISINLLLVALLSFFKPFEIISYYPRFAVNTNNETAVTVTGGIIAIILAIWILSGKYKFTSALTLLIGLCLTLFINFFNLRFVLETAPVFAIALSMTVRYYPRIRVISGIPTDDDLADIAEIDPTDENSLV